MRTIAGIIALTLAAGTADAQGLLVYGGAKLEFKFDQDGPGTGTNSFFSGYVEAEVSGIYGGLLGKLANDDLLDEVNLYFGYRNTTAGGVDYTVYYTRYYYPGDGGDGGGEFSLELDAPLGSAFTASADVYYSPSFEGVSALGSAYVGGAWTVTDAIELSATYGSYEVDGAGNEQEWDIGGTYSLGEETAVDLRWYDGTEYVDGYIGLKLTWDSTLVGG
jgi:hypothetical protein